MGPINYKTMMITIRCVSPLTGHTSKLEKQREGHWHNNQGTEEDQRAN